MASTNRYNSFTITQAFLGAPLNFEPVLGSKELEDLIDLYVIGSASKQNKLSEVTLDFYNNATVDLNTGALTRTYNVLPAANTFEQSPTSQSSGFSPAANFGDSGYGSFSASMTPPAVNARRVSKRPRKETKKEAEIRLPGFSIMTKDGIDVTSSAGRGTKTKEQREHAHLMRIMKACADCKRKKIRCDPSHRISQDMSRTSTSTTKSSSSQPKPSTPSTMPSLTPQTSYASGSTPSFSPSNAIDDFVLFPEDTWNTDMSLAGLETQDLGQFNFDLNDLNQFPQDSSFDFSFDPQLSNFQFDNNFGHTPLMVDQYGLDQWASSFGGEWPVHTSPHPSASTRDSGGLDSSFEASWLYDVSDVSPTINSLASSPSDHQRQPHLESQRGGSLVSTCLPLIAGNSDFDVQIHHYRSHGQANGTLLGDTVASIDSSFTSTSAVNLSPELSMSPANGPLYSRRTENVPPSASLLSQSTTSNTATTSSLAQSIGLPQDGPLVLQTGASLGSIPPTATSYQTQTSAAHQLVLPLLATLFASYIASANGVSMSLSPCLRYFFVPLALSYLLPTSTTAASSALSFASMVIAALSTAPVFNNLDFLRQASSQWIGTDPVVAMIKLVLCAVITAQLPRLLVLNDIWTRMGPAIMAFLSQFDQQSCQSTSLLSHRSSSEECGREANSMSSWLAAMRELSSVIVS